MKDELITFETAKLAKEKGFKLQSNPFGYVTKFYNHNTRTLLSYGRTGRTDLSKAYYAPTQSLLQRWLREVHDIHVSVRKEGMGFFLHVQGEVNRYVPVSHPNDIKTYESGLEEGLQEALKLIKL